jgi:acyl-CoA reductase-like NAD-dependent aldehyde dehydrogenase
MTLPKYDILIGGEWQGSSSGAYFETHNPYTGKPWALIPRCNEGDAARAVQAASDAFERGPWPAMTATQRGALLRKLGDLLTEHAEPLAQTEVRDNGTKSGKLHGARSQRSMMISAALSF